MPSRPTITTQQVRLRDVVVGDVVLFPARKEPSGIHTNVLVPITGTWREVKDIVVKMKGEQVIIRDRDEDAKNADYMIVYIGWKDELVLVQVEGQ